MGLFEVVNAGGVGIGGQSQLTTRFLGLHVRVDNEV